MVADAESKFCPDIKGGCLKGGCAFWMEDDERCGKVIVNLQDSLEIGTAGKGGAIKVYTDALKPSLGLIKLDNMINLRRIAQEKMVSENAEVQR